MSFAQKHGEARYAHALVGRCGNQGQVADAVAVEIGCDHLQGRRIAAQRRAEGSIALVIDARKSAVAVAQQDIDGPGGIGLRDAHGHVLLSVAIEISDRDIGEPSSSGGENLGYLKLAVALPQVHIQSQIAQRHQIGNAVAIEIASCDAGALIVQVEGVGREGGKRRASLARQAAGYRGKQREERRQTGSASRLAHG
jgi:hypothetical protein